MLAIVSGYFAVSHMEFCMVCMESVRHMSLSKHWDADKGF